MANPYASGIAVQGGGNWAVSQDPSGNLVANTGFGSVPVFQPNQVQWTQTAQRNASGLGPMQQVVQGTVNGQRVGSYVLQPGQTFDPKTGMVSSSSAGAWGQPGQNSQRSINDLAQYGTSLQTSDGGAQGITYALDPATGYLKPTSAQGHAQDKGSWIDDMIKYGAMGGAAIAGGAAALGYGSGAGVGAQAVGGSAADAGAAAGAGAAGGAAPIVDMSTAAPAEAGGAAAGSGAGSGLASDFAGGQYVDPLATSTLSDAGVPGATGTFNSAAPLTGDALGSGSAAGASGLSNLWNNLKPSQSSLVNQAISQGAKLLAPQAPVPQAGAQQYQPQQYGPTAVSTANQDVSNITLPTVQASTPRTGLINSYSGG